MSSHQSEPVVKQQQLRTNNHYVPKLYLKQWATDEKIPTYALLVPHANTRIWKHHSLKGIAYHQHLYTQMAGGKESDDLERLLDSEFEAPAEHAISCAVTDRRLTPQDWRNLIRFAFAQDVRTPARLREFLHRQSRDMPPLLENTVNEFVKRHQNEIGLPRSAPHKHGEFPLKLHIEEKEDGGGLLRAEAVVGRKMWHWSLRHLLEDTINKITYKGWSILRAAPGCYWPTSDNPLIRLNYMNEAQYDFKGGWEVPNGDVLLPLSPTRLLHRCSGKRPMFREHRLDPATSEKMKKVIIEHADRYVFAKEEFDVQTFRSRTVNRDLYAAEQKAWKDWHTEQSEVESTG